jgi:hypothetical protein
MGTSNDISTSYYTVWQPTTVWIQNSYIKSYTPYTQFLKNQPLASRHITTYKALARWPLSHTNGKHSMQLIFCDITPCTAWKLATFTFKAAVITSAYSVIPQKTLVTMWQLQITHVPQTEEMLLAVNVFYAMERGLHSFTTNDERKRFWWIYKVYKYKKSYIINNHAASVIYENVSYWLYIYQETD